MMKLRFSLAAILAAIPMAAFGGGSYEASANLDLKDVRPLLERIARSVDDGLSAKAIADLVQLAQETPIEKERERKLTVTFKGQKAALRIRIFMDDVDSPDIYFFTPSKTLAGRISDEIEMLNAELGR